LAVRADLTRLKQCIINILSNAIKYNVENGSVSVTIKADKNKRSQIIISDTGIGIASDHIDDLFKPFNRLGAEKTNIEGSGIGLALTKKIIDMMDGNLYVESKCGVGSKFSIKLISDTITDTITDNKTLETTAEQLNKNTNDIIYKVLYIEDNPANLRLVEQLILSQYKNVKFLSAHTPSLGFELAIIHKPNLIILDIKLPEINGFQLLEKNKANDELKNISVIALSANASQTDIERGYAAGFEHYLTKPLNFEEFFNTLNIYTFKK